MPPREEYGRTTRTYKLMKLAYEGSIPVDTNWPSGILFDPDLTFINLWSLSKKSLINLKGQCANVVEGEKTYCRSIRVYANYLYSVICSYLTRTK